MFFVRTASARDLKAVSDLLMDSFHVTYDRLHGKAKVDQLNASWNTVAALKALMGAPHSEFLIADNGTEIGGMAFALLLGDTGVVKLRKLYVKPGLEGQGIGSDLFAEIETCFPEAKRIRVEVDVGNADALRFYKRVGFSEVGAVADCGGDGSGLPAFCLEKPVEGF